MCNSVFFVPMRDKSNAIVELADNYCNLGGRVAEVVTERPSPKGKTCYYKIYTESQSWVNTLLKVASYIIFLGIPWLVACAIKACHRYSINYEEFSLPQPTQNQEDAPRNSNPIADELVDHFLDSDEELSASEIFKTILRSMSAQQPEESVSLEPASNLLSSIKIEHNWPTTQHPMLNVQQQLFEWWSEKDESGQFKNRVSPPIKLELVSSLQQLAEKDKITPKKEVILVFQAFIQGFGFFYGCMPEGNKHLPIPRQIGCLLAKAKETGIDLPLLTRHPANQEIIVQVKESRYITASCKNTDTLPSRTGGVCTGDYLSQLISHAEKEPESEAFRVLEALIAYAFNVKKHLGNELYQKLRTLIPAYPENPDAALS
jgi:hypothetical protein